MSQEKTGLDYAEIVSAVASVGGAIATIAGQSAAYATVPLSLSVVLNLFNRNQLLNKIENQHQQDIATLLQNVTEVRDNFDSSLNKHITSAQQELKQLGQTNKSDLEVVRANLAQEDQNLRKSLENLEYEKNKIAEVVGQLQQIENFSQAIRTNPNCGDFYYRRGLSHQSLGNKEGAIGDYTKAISLEPNHAGAHHQRGILNSELGNRKQAVEDLRRAAKLYFDQGDVDSYQQARDLSKEFHEIHSPATEEAFEKIKIANFLNN
jgi:tetratricopeptide (TPR) repeat protein